MDQYSEGAIKRALHTYISFKIANLLLAFVFQITVAKILLPAQFATYAILLAILMAGERALSFGIDRTILRFVPTLTRHKDVTGLLALVARVAVLRLVALVVLLAAGLFGAQFINAVLPIKLGTSTLLAFEIWFVSYMFTADADALAQSWMAHFESSFAATVEVVARISILVILTRFHPPNAQDIVVICTCTSTVAMILMVYRLARFIKPLISRTAITPRRIEDSTFDPKVAPKFALANFSSTITYLISSPPVVRIMATGGLDVISLAAFSFAQGLYISLQRIFPGLLILPTLEPLIMSQLVGDVRGDRVYASLSLVYKLELSCILAVLIATSVAGTDIVEILSRRAYAPYYFVLPILIGSLALITSYRIFELIANTSFKQHIFFWLWPLSFLAMLAMYATVGSWGLVSVLLWPGVEIVVRIGILAFLLRHLRVWRAFDPRRSLLLVSCAAVIIFFLLLLRQLFPVWLQGVNLILAAAGVIGFLGSFFVMRPLRQLEYEVLLTAIPKSFWVVHRIASMVTCRQSVNNT